MISTSTLQQVGWYVPSLFLQNVLNLFVLVQKELRGTATRGLIKVL